LSLARVAVKDRKLFVIFLPWKKEARASVPLKIRKKAETARLFCGIPLRTRRPLKWRILISGFFGVSQVNAENVIVEQLNKDTVEAIPSIGLFGSQTLGTGLTGEISEIIMWGKTGGGNVDAEIFLHECLIGYSYGQESSIYCFGGCRCF